MKFTNLYDECDNIKKRLINALENFDCKTITDIYDNHFKSAPMLLPKEEIKHNNDKVLCLDLYGSIFKDFVIKQIAINEIVGDNWIREYMHVFFITSDKESKDLKLLFRFSDIETFTKGRDYNIDFSKDPTTGEVRENAYELLEDGSFIHYNISSVKLEELSENYSLGEIGRIIMTPNTPKDVSITEYITYNIKDILLFKGFEHNLIFEAVVSEDRGKFRLCVDVKIKDKNRVHHTITNDTGMLQNVMEGYYDLGNLKP